MKELLIAVALAASASWAPSSISYGPRSSGPKNGKTARRAKQKDAKKAKQQARRMK